ncbi:MAG: bifunctional precorrin-2 dehydrogenase/sirohydrochlorin ferrochelatase [Deltaproteobacteria bacterium]|nr:bifunctional precorrin-2 dehydrogenase/sirohydrochlorin ferrochelatase [Deltaproteobacteria bacterium]
MRYYPIFLDIKDKPCVVIGGGKVAERKVLSLLDAGARVVVISPRVTPTLKRLVSKKEITHCPKAYESGDLKGFTLAYSATDSKTVSQRVYEEAKREGILLNVVDAPGLCSFIVPSLVERGDLLIAISTSGKSPAMAKRLRKKLELEFGDEYQVFLRLMGVVRDKLLKKARESAKNKRVFEKLVDSPLLSWIRGGKKRDINRLLKKTLGSEFTLSRLKVKI